MSRKLHKVIRPVAAPSASRVTVPAPSAPVVFPVAAAAIRNLNVVNANPVSAPIVSAADDKAPTGKPLTRKQQLVQEYTRSMGVAPSKSWTAAEIASNLAAGKLPRSSAAKKQAAELYTQKTGAAPAKSWSIKTIVANTNAGKLPGTRSGGLTADVCRKLLAAARKNGVNVPAYSKLSADALRQLVGQLKLAA